MLLFTRTSFTATIMHTKCKKSTLAHEVLGFYLRKTPRVDLRVNSNKHITNSQLSSPFLRLQPVLE